MQLQSCLTLSRIRPTVPDEAVSWYRGIIVTGCYTVLIPNLPLEFVVYGVAVSHGAGPASRNAWRQRVRDAAREELPADYFALDFPVAVTIYFFPQSEMQADIDNCAKPILDAMTKCIYLDDKQVDRLVVQKFEPERPLEIPHDPSESLTAALAASDPVVYVKIGTDLRGE